MKPAIAVPAIGALVYRAYSRKSLTPLGIATAFLTAVAHAIHPYSVCFALLAVFFLLGTAVTKVKHNIKATLTQSSTGLSGGEGPRTHIQVLANSLAASLLILLDTWRLHSHSHSSGVYSNNNDLCWRKGSDVLLVGIVANYAAVAADTFSSELGILATGKPRLITAPWRVVPPGTNGGVTLTGLGAGLLGAFCIAATSTLLLPFCGNWSTVDKAKFTLAITLAGLGGSVIDSFLGAVFQASVVDLHSGKVIEGEGGRKVLIHGSHAIHQKASAKVRSGAVSYEEGKAGIAKTSGIDDSAKAKRREQEAGLTTPEGKHESRKVEVGLDLLDNNAVNLLMAASISVGSMVVACAVWGLPLSSVVAI